ncbi:hypothetical protein DFJ43DRAFT_301236 [Lentinula guzmanii]|uniref:Secreted protein n=1 Tax=Lentinula guzmanii TaxID=2804957 RepID=A0AA38N0F8_9AGAR|nr:hypothetical protein DFJ43DRAFT_301236 [Lentinula guzmanii]
MGARHLFKWLLRQLLSQLLAIVKAIKKACLAMQSIQLRYPLLLLLLPLRKEIILEAFPNLFKVIFGRDASTHLVYPNQQ